MYLNKHLGCANVSMWKYLGNYCLIASMHNDPHQIRFDPWSIHVHTITTSAATVVSCHSLTCVAHYSLAPKTAPRSLSWPCHDPVVIVAWGWFLQRVNWTCHINYDITKAISIPNPLWQCTHTTHISLQWECMLVVWYGEVDCPLPCSH